jgi:hypothetical protein
VSGWPEDIYDVRELPKEPERKWVQCAKCTAKATEDFGEKRCDKGGTCEWVDEYGPIDGPPLRPMRCHYQVTEANPYKWRRCNEPATLRFDGRFLCMDHRHAVIYMGVRDEVTK